MYSDVTEYQDCIEYQDLGSIPVLGRSSGEGKGYPCQYSVSSMGLDCIVPGVAKSRTQLSDFHFHQDCNIKL